MTSAPAATLRISVSPVTVVVAQSQRKFSSGVVVGSEVGVGGASGLHFPL